MDAPVLTAPAVYTLSYDARSSTFPRISRLLAPRDHSARRVPPLTTPSQKAATTACATAPPTTANVARRRLPSAAIAEKHLATSAPTGRTPPAARTPRRESQVPASPP